VRALSGVVLLMCCVLAGPPAGAADHGLDVVLAQLALRQHGHVEFVEQHFLKVLDRPTESSGEMRYDAPDRLEKRTLAPRPETMLLAGGILTVDKGKTHRVVDLHAYPQVQPFIESIRATLAGDRAALEKLFTLEFTGDLARWTLTLQPKDPKVKHTVAQVRIDGAKDQLSKVEIRQPDGDRSVLTLRPSPAP
jgi:hypothetical protein